MRPSHAVWGGLCLAGALTLIPTMAFATAIGVVRSTEELVVAVDSRVSTGLGRAKGETCKIRVVNDTIVVIHGYLGDSSGFDLFAIVARELAAGTLRADADRVAYALSAPFRAVIEAIRVNSPEVFRYMMRLGIGAGAVLARYEHGAPRFVNVELRPRLLDTTTFDLEPIVHACHRFDCGRQNFLSGATEEAAVEFERGRLTFWTEPPAEAAIAFVQGEIARGTAIVGPPIQVIRVTRDGITWLRREGPCRR